MVPKICILFVIYKPFLRQSLVAQFLRTGYFAISWYFISENRINKICYRNVIQEATWMQSRDVTSLLKGWIDQSFHFPFTLLPSPAHLPKSKCQHACKHKFQLNEFMVWGPLKRIMNFPYLNQSNCFLSTISSCLWCLSIISFEIQISVNLTQVFVFSHTLDT